MGRCITQRGGSRFKRPRRPRRPNRAKTTGGDRFGELEQRVIRPDGCHESASSRQNSRNSTVRDSFEKLARSPPAH